MKKDTMVPVINIERRLSRTQNTPMPNTSAHVKNAADESIPFLVSPENFLTSRKMNNAVISVDIAEGRRMAKLFSPKANIDSAFIQYPIAGFSKYRKPLRYGTTQLPAVII